MAEKSTITTLADSLGTGEHILRLILSLFAGYPLAFFYRGFIHGSRPHIQHVFFIVTGLLLSFLNFGVDSIHSIINIVSVWVLIQVLGGTAVSVFIAFTFNTVYLLYGYYHAPDSEYDISWTTPHCLITLRLTGIMFDLYDGQKNKEKLSSEQKENALKERPGLLEIMGHSYFFGGFLVGPLFSMVRYQNFVQGKYSDVSQGRPPKNIVVSFIRMLLGIGYIALFQVLTAMWFTNTYMVSADFQDQNFFVKCGYIAVWGKLHMCKYVGCWLIVEGSCMLTSLTYNGKDGNGNCLWNGCSNVHLYQLESASTFREVIAGFNINTNSWMARYIFKRAKFLGNRHISQLLTLTYLAVWHGLHTGYYMNFFLEFIMVNGEIEIKKLLDRLPAIKDACSKSSVKQLVWCLKKVLTQFFVSYALVSFVQLKWERYSVIYSSVFYIGHGTFLALPVICYIISLGLSKSSAAATDRRTVQENGTKKLQ